MVQALAPPAFSTVPASDGLCRGLRCRRCRRGRGRSRGGRGSPIDASAQTERSPASLERPL
eukprot:9275949-Lingulodinium_polyedra.AAC.1